MGAGNRAMREAGQYQTQTKPSSTASMLGKPLTANLYGEPDEPVDQESGQ